MKAADNHNDNLAHLSMNQIMINNRKHSLKHSMSDNKNKNAKLGSQSNIVLPPHNF